MLTNGQFLSSFVFTLCLVAGLATLAGIVFVINRVWRLSQPFREWFRRSWFARLIREMGVIARIAKACVKSFTKSTLTFLVVRPWQIFVALLTALGSILREVPWGICIGVLVVGTLPFFVFTSVGIPLRSIIGIVAAGALIGTFCAPFTGWHYKALGPSKVISVSLLTIVGGAWGSSLLVATLIAMASD